MKEIELKHLRNEYSKCYLQENGDIVANIFKHPIHFKNGDSFEEIDNTIIKENSYYINSANSFKTFFSDTTKNGLVTIKKDQYYLEMYLEDSNIVNLEKRDDITVCYPNIKTNIDLEYKILSSGIKENIIIQNKEDILDSVSFYVKTNLELILENDNSILAYDHNTLVYKMDSPYLLDNNQNKSNNIQCELLKDGLDYILTLKLDKEWLDKATYPVIIDPTITNPEKGVYDTYIYSGDTNVTRYNQDILKAGVEKVGNSNRINRTLLKFDLPVIGTGYQVVEAWLTLIGYASQNVKYPEYPLCIHRITSNWEEKKANWTTMNNKYDSRVVAMLSGIRSRVDSSNVVTPFLDMANITDLVQKWYADTPNHGIMIKSSNEVYDISEVPAYFSKDNKVNGTVEPTLTITYRNQTGLENYLDYQQQQFTQGSMYVNSYNGNITGVFSLANTIGGKLPIGLNLIYNTHAAILNQNRCGLGVGYQFDLGQTIKPQKIDQADYLEYIDGDGTSHYFFKSGNIYKDEDGLQLTIEKVNDEYILKDSNSNQMKFTIVNTIGYLSKIINSSDNQISIQYDSNLRINKLIDDSFSEINITYETNRILIVTSCETTILDYSNNKLVSITFKLGVTNISYNTLGLLDTIYDISGRKLKYSYCSEKPYRVKRVEEYGSEDTLGNSFTMSYNLLSTTITDNKGRVKTITYNTYGNPISISTLSSKEDIGNAYAISHEYGESFENSYTCQNKLLSSGIPIQYVKNYLTNTSFERNNIPFISSSNTSISISKDCYCTGLSSLKLSNSIENEEVCQEVVVPKNQYYTFSAYIKNTNKMRIALGYKDSNNVGVLAYSKEIEPSDEFIRSDISIYYPDSAIGKLNIIISLDEIGTTYVDDIQLEEGEVANNYNLLENSDFSNQFDNWELVSYNSNTGNSVNINNYFEVVTLSTGKKALKIKMSPIISTGITKKFDIHGLAGDSYYISFWYKNEGVIADGYDISNTAMINFFTTPDLDNGQCILAPVQLNTNPDEWQYFSYNFTVSEDYTGISLDIYQMANANNLYITNLCLYKDIRQDNYNYDDKGNVISLSNTDNEITSLNYDSKNQLIKMTDPKGKRFIYEYDNTITNRVLCGISESGICTEIKYDSNGNPCFTKISNKTSDELENKEYSIRLKGTKMYLRNIERKPSLKEEDCIHDKWILTKEGEYFSISHSLILNNYLTVRNGKLLLDTYDVNASLFKLEKQANGSYRIEEKQSKKCLKEVNGLLFLDTFVNDDYHYQFYFEIDDTKEFFENEAKYTEDGKFVTSITDSNLNTIQYDVNSITGLTNSIIDDNGKVTEYTYDNKDRVTTVKKGEHQVDYEYDNHNQLAKITEGNKDYNFSYDEFGNTKQVKIGNTITLVTNEYESNNGNLLAAIYGNNHEISYQYDELNRLKSTIKMNDIYHFRYDSNGNLAKVLSNDGIMKYYYDLAKRLKQYEFKGMKIKYIYDKNSNISDKKYQLTSTSHTIHNNFNKDDFIDTVAFDGNEIHYHYDSLGRLIGKDINNQFFTTYEYMSNGNRTTNLIKLINNNGDIYEYIYDKSGNIVNIFHNGVMENKYYYDECGQLAEENYRLNGYTRRITNNDDNHGNILVKRHYRSDYSLIGEETFEFNNSNWEDQLTKYGDIEYVYDEIGNPICIGNTTLTWINGRQLESYGNNHYKYDINGIRISKIVDNVETKYHLEGNKIIFEEKGNDVIYYIYNGNDIIGFQYNDEVYYYIKNIQQDIIGILDSNYNVVARYTYDAWGNILFIQDTDGHFLYDEEDHIANINPFRYRSYYYDSEIKLYYLNSRYYDPSIGRFLNADGIIGANQDLLGYNLYAYCSNNPIMFSDLSGREDMLIEVSRYINSICTKIGATLATLFGGKTLNYNLSIKMFNHALYGYGKPLSNSTLLELKNEIINAIGTKKIKDYLKTQTADEFTVTPYLEFTSGDLHYAVQHADLLLTGKRYNGVWQVKVVVSDTYNFDNYREGFSISDILNNYGYNLSQEGLLIPYYWEINYYIYISEESLYG